MGLFLESQADILKLRSLAKNLSVNSFINILALNPAIQTAINQKKNKKPIRSIIPLLKLKIDTFSSDVDSNYLKLGQ